MNDTDLVKLKAKIDADLTTARPEVSIAFGADAYMAFVARGWLVYKPFSPVGVGSVKVDLPTYQGHYAACDPRLADDDGVVGK